MDLTSRAISKAVIAHSGQFRKGTDNKVPYSVHPIRVGMMLNKEFVPEFVIAAGFLHDVHEDTTHKLTIRKFPQETIDLVDLLTKDPQDSKIQAVEKVKSNGWAILIKMADRLDNFSDNSEVQQEYVNRPVVRESTLLLLKYAFEQGVNNTEIYTSLKEKMGFVPLEEGRTVGNQDGVEGVVIPSGNYGEQPFQVKTNDGEYYSYIECDGTSLNNDNVWVVL